MTTEKHSFIAQFIYRTYVVFTMPNFLQLFDNFEYCKLSLSYFFPVTAK